jgi:23S rRNA (pseudouridine1915-N3)-methyltransferase
MKITIITIGKSTKHEISQLIEDYSKRIKPDIEWIIIPHQTKTKLEEKIKKQESDLIITRLQSFKNAYKILLDETGKIINSVDLADIINNVADQSLNLIFIIGGSYGVSDDLKSKADFIWSISKLVFPHQIIRLIIVEQIYRAICINQGSKYHHQ